MLLRGQLLLAAAVSPLLQTEEQPASVPSPACVDIAGKATGSATQPAQPPPQPTQQQQLEQLHWLQAQERGMLRHFHTRQQQSQTQATVTAAASAMPSTTMAASSPPTTVAGHDRMLARNYSNPGIGPLDARMRLGSSQGGGGSRKIKHKKNAQNKKQTKTILGCDARSVSSIAFASEVSQGASECTDTGAFVAREALVAAAVAAAAAATAATAAVAAPSAYAVGRMGIAGTQQQQGVKNTARDTVTLKCLREVRRASFFIVVPPLGRFVARQSPSTH